MKKLNIRFCPECKSENVSMARGDNIWWKCTNCGYESAIFPEKEIKHKLNKTIKK